MGGGSSDGILKDHPWIVVVCHLGMAMETLAFAQSKVHLLRLFEIIAALLIMTYTLIVTKDPFDCHAIWSFFHFALNTYKLFIAYYKLWRQMRQLQPWDITCREWFFNNFTDQEFLALREHWEWVLLEEDDVVIQEGEEVEHMSMIFQGQAEIRLDNRKEVLASIGPGSWIGEMAFFTGELASATVMAGKQTLLIRWNIEEIKKIISTPGRSYKAQAFAKLPSHFCADLARKVKQYNSMPAMQNFINSQKQQKEGTGKLKRFDNKGRQSHKMGGFTKLASVRKSWVKFFVEDPDSVSEVHIHEEEMEEKSNNRIQPLPSTKKASGAERSGLEYQTRIRRLASVTFSKPPLGLSELCAVHESHEEHNNNVLDP